MVSDPNTVQNPPLLEGLVRSPYQLSGVLQALGDGALAQVGRLLGEWLSVGEEYAEPEDEAAL